MTDVRGDFDSIAQPVAITWGPDEDRVDPGLPFVHGVQNEHRLSRPDADGLDRASGICEPGTCGNQAGFAGRGLGEGIDDRDPEPSKGSCNAVNRERLLTPHDWEHEDEHEQLGTVLHATPKDPAIAVVRHIRRRLTACG